MECEFYRPTHCMCPQETPLGNALIVWSISREATGFCSIDGTAFAVCTAIAKMDAFRISVTESSTLTGDQVKFYPVTITAGAEKLAEVTETGTRTATRSATETESASESASDNGALPRITGVANWVIGGGAMAVVLAAM